jgi:hypothetical protein
MKILDTLSETPVFCVSGALTLAVTNFINGPEDEREMGNMEMIARKFVGALGYAGLALASLVEAVARIVLTALVAPVCCCASTGLQNYLVGLTLYGGVLCIENSILDLALLVQNLYTSRLELNEDTTLIECFDGINEGIIEPILLKAPRRHGYEEIPTL